MSTTFTTEMIRNVAVTGHSDTGKTSLVAAMLLNGGAANRLLKVDDGNTVTDFDDALKTLVADMFETMYDAPGIGLAAIQVGVPKRVLVIDGADR